MPIDFRCTTCQKLLLTGDDTAGKQAKCPQCGTIMTIPAADAGPLPGGPPGAAPTPWTPAADAAGANPYQSPQSQTMPDQTFSGDSPFQSATLDIGDVFGRTWEIFKDQMGMCIGVALVAGLVYFCAGRSSGRHRWRRSGDAQPCPANYGQHHRQHRALYLQHVSANGRDSNLPENGRGQPFTFGQLFAGGPQLLPFIGASILVGLSTWLGLIFCIVPGIIIALMFSQVAYLVLDQNVPVFDSFTRSKILTYGNKMNLFVIGLLAILLSLAGAIPCGLGLIFVIPYLRLLMVVVYLTLMGEQTVRQSPAEWPAS